MNRIANHRPRLRAAVVVGLAGVGLVAMPAQAAPAQVAADTQMPISVTLTPTIEDCGNHGSKITIEGTVGMAGLDGVTVFKNNVKGTKTTEVGRSSTTAVAAGIESFPKQPVLGGVGGNPYIGVGIAQVVGGVLQLMGDTVQVGRCVQGQTLSSATVEGALQVSASAIAQATTCESSGSLVTLATTASSPALYAVLVFDNNKNKVVHRRIEPTDTVVQLTGGQTHKGWGQANGAGGNPLVYLVFDDKKAATTDPEFFLGRCKDLL